MSRPQFLFDENIPVIIPAALKQREPAVSVFMIDDGQAPAKGTPDPDLLIWVEENDCLLVTNNRASMPVHLRDHIQQGRYVPGIIQLPRLMNVASIVEELLLIWEAVQPNEFQNQIIHLPL